MSEDKGPKTIGSVFAGVSNRKNLLGQIEPHAVFVPVHEGENPADVKTTAVRDFQNGALLRSFNSVPVQNIEGRIAQLEALKGQVPVATVNEFKEARRALRAATSDLTMGGRGPAA